MSNTNDNNEGQSMMREYANRASLLKTKKKFDNLKLMKNKILSLKVDHPLKTSTVINKSTQKDIEFVSQLSSNTSFFNNSNAGYSVCNTCPINYINCLIMDHRLKTFSHRKKLQVSHPSFSQTEHKTIFKLKHTLPINYLPNPKPLKFFARKKKRSDL